MIGNEVNGRRLSCRPGIPIGALLVAIWGLVPRTAVAEGIPPHQEARIRAAAPEGARVTPPGPRRVLVWSTPPHLEAKDPHRGYCVPYGLAAMRILGEKTGAYEAVVSRDLSVFLEENLRGFDAVILNNACGAWITPDEGALERLAAHGDSAEEIEQALRRSLLDYVSDGGGLVAYHFAIGANRHWPEFHRLLGATFTGHPWNEEVGVLIEEPGHALAAAFENPRFRVADEIYQYGPPYDRSKLRVLLSLDTSRTNMGVKWIRREDNDFALAWIKSHGKGRVFYTSFGHRTEIWWNPTLLRFYLDGIQFATGDLEAPTAPRASRPAQRAPGATPPEIRATRLAAANVREPTDEELKEIEAAAPGTAPVSPSGPRRVLVWGHSWTHPPNPHAEKALEILARKTGAFEVMVSDDPRFLLGDRIQRFDALVMNNIHQPDPFLPPDLGTLDAEQQAAAQKFDAAVKASILEFVEGGKGLVGIHAATAAFHTWPEWKELIGGKYGGHIHREVPIKLDDPSHPVNAALGVDAFKINDEVYIFRDVYSRDRLRVLSSLDLSRMADPGERPDGDYAVSWVRSRGKGRVFYTTLGHAPESYRNPVFLRMLLAGIQFATGDLPGDTTPGPTAD